MANLLETLSIGSRRALRLFQSMGYDLVYNEEKETYSRMYPEDGTTHTDILVGEKSSLINYYVNDFLPSWGKNDWTLAFLIQLNQKYCDRGIDVIKFVFLDICNIQASSSDLLAQLQTDNAKRLQSIKPTVHVDTEKSGAYLTEEDIIVAQKSGKLCNLNLSSFDESSQYFVSGMLFNIVKRIDEKVMNNRLDGLLRVSSSVRSLFKQQIYRELGYPAVDISNHNFGLAFDLALSHTKRKIADFPYSWQYYADRLNTEQKKSYLSQYDTQRGISFAQLFRIYLGFYNNETYIFSSDKIKMVNSLSLRSVPITIQLLVDQEVIQLDDPLVKLFQILKNTQELEVIDETPFFSINNCEYTDKNGNKVRTKFVLPVYHCQLQSRCLDHVT